MISLFDSRLNPSCQLQNPSPRRNGNRFSSSLHRAMRDSVWGGLILVAFAILPSIGLGQQPVSTTGQPAAGDQRTELGVRQKLVQRKMVELEAKFTIVAERIREKDAKRADLLILTYQQSKERSLTKKMENVSELLNQQQYDAADQELNDVVTILESLIRMLTNEKEKAISAQDEIAMLEQFKKNVQEQLQKQREQTRDTEKAANKEDAAQQVQAQIKALNRLIDSQKKLVGETEKNQKANLKKLDNIADKQFEIRKQTDRLKDNISGQKNDINADGSFKKQTAKSEEAADRDAAGENDGDGESGDSQEPGKEGSSRPNETGGESKSGDTKDGKSGEPKESDAKNGESGDDESKDDESKEGESQDGESEDGESKDGESKSGESKEGKPGKGQPSQGQSPPSDSSEPSPSDESSESNQPDSSPPPPPQPGQKSLEKSAQHQQRAEEKLGSGKSDDAKREQEKALQELENALSELEKEKRRIESLPPEILEQLAREQRRNRDKTMDIVKAMEKSPKGQPASEDQQNGGPQPPQKQPGQESMEQAGNAQQQAAEDMQQNDPESAKKEQKKAEQQMENALDEIEERLSQLREETNEEKLARLEARFKEMLDRQTVASVMTTEIEDKRFNLGQLRLRDQLLILRLATEELEIRELAQQAYDLLLEDGTSIVFPEVVQDLRSDLKTAGDLLQSERTDQYTQLVQKEIEITIQDLLDALQDAKKEKESGGGGGGGGGGDQPLLKKSAELKILRMRQRRLNRRTKKLEIMRESPAMDEVLKKEISDAAQMQKKILDMTDNIMKKQ